MAWLSIGAMLASAYLQNDAASSAADRQQQEAVRAQQRQAEQRSRANKVVMDRAQEFDAENRASKQADMARTIEGQLTKSADAPAITAQGVTIGAGLSPQSADYKAVQGKEQTRVANSLHQLASLMGRTGSAGQLRQGEAIGIGDTAGALGRIQTGANNIGQIDKTAIELAGQPSVGQMIAGQALGGYGMGSLAKSGLGSAVKYAGSSRNPLAPNYENQMDLGNIVVLS